MRVERILHDLEGSEKPPVMPLPLRIACDLHRIPYHVVSDACLRGDLPEVEEARARGLALCLRMAGKGTTDPKPWLWLAERLRPKELHIPRVHTHQGSEDPSAPPINHRVELTLSDARNLARGKVTVTDVKKLPGG